MPDHAAAFAGLVARRLVHHEIIERLALIGPLLGAIVTGDDLPIAHVLVGGFGLEGRHLLPEGFVLPVQGMGDGFEQGLMAFFLFGVLRVIRTMPVCSSFSYLISRKSFTSISASPWLRINNQWSVTNGLFS